MQEDLNRVSDGMKCNKLGTSQVGATFMAQKKMLRILKNKKLTKKHRNTQKVPFMLRKRMEKLDI